MTQAQGHRVRLRTTSPATFNEGEFEITPGAPPSLEGVVAEVRRRGRDAVVVAPAAALRHLVEEILQVPDRGAGRIEILDQFETVLQVTQHRVTLKYLNRGAADPIS